MVFHGALADPEIRGDIFARVTGQHHRHDLVLPSGQTREVIGGLLAPLQHLPGIAGKLQSAANPGEKLHAANRLLQEIGRPGLHGFDRHRHVALAGDHDGVHLMAGFFQTPQQIQSADSGKIGVDLKAGVATRTVGIEESLAVRIILYEAAAMLQHAANGLAHLAVVIDDENHRRGCCRHIRGGCRRT